MASCPICETKAITEDGHPFYFDCPRCGAYRIDRITKGHLNSLLDTDEKKILLIHAIRKMQDKNKESPLIDIKYVRSVTERLFPSPQDQIKNLVLWLGDNTRVFGKKIRENISTIQIEMPSLNTDTARIIIKRLENEGIIITEEDAGGWNEAHLTLMLDIKGWDLYQQLKFVANTSDTGKLLNYLIGMQTSPNNGSEKIKEVFCWNDEQFLKAYKELKNAGYIDAKYAGNKPYIIWATKKGIETIQNDKYFFSNLSIGGNVTNSNIIQGHNNNIHIEQFPKENKE